MTRANPSVPQSTPDNATMKLITDQVVAQIIAGAMPLQVLIDEFGGPLTTEQIKALTKPRYGGDEWVTSCVQVAQSHGLNFKTSPISVILPSIEAARRLQPIINVLGHMLKTLSDTSAQYESAAWSGALFYYGVMDQLAIKNPLLRSALQPLKDTMAHRSATVVEKRATAKEKRQAERLIARAALVTRRANNRKSAEPGTSTGANGVTQPAATPAQNHA